MGVRVVVRCMGVVARDRVGFQESRKSLYV